MSSNILYGNRAVFLFSIDLEDIRSLMPNGSVYEDRIEENIRRYLGFLSERNSCCTFFVVGDIARRYPGLIKEIVGLGHEIACHTDNHVPLDQMTPKQFKDDIKHNLDSLYKAGATCITGFRAPSFSLTPETSWAYDILSEVGLKYSSSILAASNPLYGWPGFGEECRVMPSGILEMPMRLSGLPFLNVPFAGGVYFRCLPLMLIKYLFHKNRKSKTPLTGYFHPYDIDCQQERFMHPGIHNKWFYNQLMYYNRKNVFKRLSILFKDSTVLTYSKYLSKSITE